MLLATCQQSYKIDERKYCTYKWPDHNARMIFIYSMLQNNTYMQLVSPYQCIRFDCIGKNKT